MSTYEEMYPPEGGPPRLSSRAGEAAESLTAKDPEYVVYLDAGAFRALWELTEATAKHRFPSHTTMSAAKAYLRGVEAFRRSYTSQVNKTAGAVERVAATKVRKVKRLKR